MCWALATDGATCGGPANTVKFRELKGKENLEKERVRLDV